jgi:predicted RND superfamily exporter protein
MSGGSTSEKDKAALYWLGERLIDYRHPVSLLVLAVTGLFAYWSFQLRLETSFGDLLPQTHAFVKIHNKYAGTFGGANNIQLMVESTEGDVFTLQTLARIYKLTEAVDQVYGVNHNQIDSIGHRTTRYLRAQSGGFLRAEPVMQGLPKSDGDATNIRRIVHNTESVYGILVSLDDRAALIRANFIEGRLDHRRTFTEINERVIAPFERGWIGALIKGRDATKPDQASPAAVEVVYRGTAAADAGLKTGDVIQAVNGVATADRAALAAAIIKYDPGATVTLNVKRGDKTEDMTLTVPKQDIKIFVAGEPRLYGYVYQYANDVFWIFTVTYCLEWILRWMYFHDWRGALRPTLTGIIAAFWGLGFVHLIGFALDPLTLVMPFLITARAVSHAIQMHDRYYEEFERHNWNQRKAIVASFAELFVPTFSGILTDAFGVLVIMLVPVVMLRKLAIVASWWILAITVAELLLNPIVYYYLREPDPEVVKQRDQGWYRRVVERFSDWNLSPFGKIFTMAFWAVLLVIGLNLTRGLIIGDPTAASPLVWEDSPYNVSAVSNRSSWWPRGATRMR